MAALPRRRTQSSGSKSSSSGGGGKRGPIGIDLDGGGVNIIALGASTAMVDYTGKGVREHTAWTGGRDGLLAIDLDGSGTINAPREFAFDSGTMAADTDMEAFRANFDTDDNGVFDARDSRWSQAGVWVDANQDGLSQAGH
jgi:hypothetical protein